MWKRALLLLCEKGEPMTFDEVATAIGVNRASAYRTLRSLELHYYVKSEKTNILRWGITDYGVNQIRSMQKKGLIPVREW